MSTGRPQGTVRALSAAVRAEAARCAARAPYYDLRNVWAPPPHRAPGLAHIVPRFYARGYCAPFMINVYTGLTRSHNIAHSATCRFGRARSLVSRTRTRAAPRQPAARPTRTAARGAGTRDTETHALSSCLAPPRPDAEPRATRSAQVSGCPALRSCLVSHRLAGRHTASLSCPPSPGAYCSCHGHTATPC